MEEKIFAIFLCNLSEGRATENSFFLEFRYIAGQNLGKTLE